VAGKDASVAIDQDRIYKPNSAMLAAICATCASECVRGLRAYGISFSIGQISILRAIVCENIALPPYLI